MARARTLSQLREEAFRKADCEGAEDRHDQADVDRDLNQGIAEFWDELIATRGGAYVQSAEPDEIATLAGTVSYDLADDFYVLVGVRIDGAGGYPLVPFEAHEEAALRDPSQANQWPTHYQLRRSVQGADVDDATITGTATNQIVLLPPPVAGLTVIVDYAPTAPELTGDDDVLDGINGWEDYAILYAAREMASRDDEDGLYAKLDKRIAEARARVQRMAPKRDIHQARRVKDVRGPRVMRQRFPPA